MEDDDHSDIDLLCYETVDDLMDIDSFDTEEVGENIPRYANIDVFVDPSLIQQHFTVLLDKKKDFGFKNDDQECLKLMELSEERSKAISWILKNRDVNALVFRTGFLSIIYFERFISKSTFKGSDRLTWLRTASATCLSLAAKMENRKGYPKLSMYVVEDCVIERKSIHIMEFRVVSILEWMMNPITPFDFIEYFITMMHYSKDYPYDTKPQHVEVLLLYLTGVIILVHHKPSVLAAAATIMAYECDLTPAEVEAKIKSFPSLNFLDIGEVCSIYRLLQEKGKSKVHNGSDSARETATS